MIGVIISKLHCTFQKPITMVTTSGNDDSTSSFILGQSEEDKYRLLYSKSKVYVNPTAYSRDNIPGFVALVKREALNPIYLLAWIPEALLNEKGSSELDKFTKMEDKVDWEESDEDVVLIELPIHRPESYTFSVPLTSVYSLSVQPPTLSAWYGSIGINLINGDTLPTLHFHDDESRSFSLSGGPTLFSSVAPTYPPAQIHAPKSTSTWGGEDLLSRLRMYAQVFHSNIQPSLFLVDPSRVDIEAHSTHFYSDNAVDDILAESSLGHTQSPIPVHRRPWRSDLSPQRIQPNPYSEHSSILHRSLPSSTLETSTTSQARQALLHSFANITRATRHAAQNILSHPLAKPIIPHLPDPVKSLVIADGECEWGSWVEKGGLGEFESARVYLARWARIVAEEGERARRREAQTVMTTSCDEETSPLGVFELLHTTSNLPTPKSFRDPVHPIDEDLWSRWFSEDGRPNIGFEELKKEVFNKGICSKGTLRRAVWPFILGIYEWDASSEERQIKWDEKQRQYNDLKNVWFGNPEVLDRKEVIEELHRINVDCLRTDRTQPLFSSEPVRKASPSRGNYRRQSTSDVSSHDDGTSSQAPTNEHIDRLAGILLTYNLFEKELGYVQGMSDICSPIYVTMDGDEPLTFWCFVEVMDRMKQNFFRDQKGMKKQLLLLQQLVALMDPELYKHFEKTNGLNMFFCFRWVLVAFKREFPFEDILRLWEVLWTDYYSPNFVLFVALAVLESHRDMILRYLVEFDEILKYCNELSMTIELDTTLSQAAVLFLSFAQLLDDIRHREIEDPPTPNGSAKHASTPSTMPKLTENLKELLHDSRHGSS